ncbi:MAG: GtrA family protein [Acidimicrobiales bacterium]|nr:GtrA family protein [Acidimicrobiales bacterium]
MARFRHILLNFVDGRWGPAGRYVLVSAINVLDHQILLYVANSIWGWPGAWANAFAASVAFVPAYFLTRTLVWSVNRTHSVRREVVPFFALAVLGLLVSSGTSAVAQAIFGAGLFVNGASMTGYVGVWVAKFFVLERIFAGDHEEAPGPIGESLPGSRVRSV